MTAGAVSVGGQVSIQPGQTAVRHASAMRLRRRFSEADPSSLSPNASTWCGGGGVGQTLRPRAIRSLTWIAATAHESSGQPSQSGRPCCRSVDSRLNETPPLAEWGENEALDGRNRPSPTGDRPCLGWRRCSSHSSGSRSGAGSLTCPYRSDAVPWSSPPAADRRRRMTRPPRCRRQ